MRIPDDDRTHLLRRFEATVSGEEVADLRRLAVGPGHWATARRPDLRRGRLPRPRRYTIRADLVGSRPPIHRVLALRSDLPLNVVHEAIQAAFDWSNAHLHRFSVAGLPFHLDAQVFLCPFDHDDAVSMDDRIADADVCLEEVLREPGDVLHYVYDYDTGLQVALRLDVVEPCPPYAPVSVVVSGERAAPPEHSGAGLDEASIARVVGDPDAFDVSLTNKVLRNAPLTRRASGMEPRLLEIVDFLRDTAVGALLVRAAHAVAEPEPGSDRVDLHEALSCHLHYLDIAAGDGVRLTEAGYLPPRDVAAAAQIVPAMHLWRGPQDREHQATPLLAFRLWLQGLGLLHVRHRRLRLTRSGARARENPALLWHLLAHRLVPGRIGFTRDATLVLLAFAAASGGRRLPLDTITAALNELGWCNDDGDAIDEDDLLALPSLTVIVNVDCPRHDRERAIHISLAAAALARVALSTRRVAR